MEVHHISPERIGFDLLKKAAQGKIKISLSEVSASRVSNCRKYLDEKIASQTEPIYGVTTGFGSLCYKSISQQELGTLQKNLVMSHACGMGEELPDEMVRLMLFLKIQSLSYGYSGVRLETIQRLVDFFNHDVLPLVFTQGSLGASGDLAPLAHLSLPLMGLGDVRCCGKKIPAKEMLSKMQWLPLELEAKEGLALLNGTQFMSAIGSLCLIQSFRLEYWADLIGAMSLEAFDGSLDPFFSKVHEIRHHEGQIKTAQRFRSILAQSQLINSRKNHVQDPYSFRCIPQVHGASKDAIAYAARVFEDEINAVTDNPTLFPDDDRIISAGNFHGQPLALALDFLGIALAELGSISERRVFRLISGARNLPSFLVSNSGLNSGFMIPQYTAASIVSQNKQLCTPASVDSIDSSQGQEDHVSMGANAAIKTWKIAQNLEKLLAIELINACQAFEFRNFQKSSPSLKKLLAAFRKKVAFIEHDIVFYQELEKARNFLIDNEPANFTD